MSEIMGARKEIIFAALGFGLSVVLTGLFIDAYGGYISIKQMLLSGVIAGGKWAIQLIVAWFILGEKKWRYYQEMGIICAIGSAILIPYILTAGTWNFFVGSLVGCVVVMGGLICWRLSKIGLGIFWPSLWFALLAFAVTLQLTVVFNVFG